MIASPLADDAWRLHPPAGPWPLRRTVLRALVRDDAPSLSWIADWEVRQHLSGAPANPEAVHRYLGWVETQSAKGALVALAVTVRDHLVGVIQAWPCDVETRAIEFGVALAREHWDQGLMHEAGSGFLRFAFTELGVTRVEARIALDNMRANKAMGRLGGRCERVVRGGLIDRRTDCYLWSVGSADAIALDTFARRADGDPRRRWATGIGPATSR